MEINQYPLESLTFQDDDFYDIDFWTGSGYQTKKILGSVIKAGILAAVENIYNADGSLNSNRTANLNGYKLEFSGATNNDLFGVNIDNSINSSTFSQTLAQIFASVYDNAISSGAVLSLLNNSVTLELEDNGTNFATIQLTFTESYLQYSDGISSHKISANANGIEINSSYILPNTDGTAGQVLTTDGAGVTSWQDGATTIVSWGDIVGTLADQTDLQAALDAKLNDPEGIASQYIRGDGTLADFPTLTGGGSAVSLYLNGGVSQGTILGGQYYQLSNIANLGPSADFVLNADGLIAQFITDVNEPNVINIPAGNWHTEFYFSASSGGGVPNFYCEIYKYDGTAFTLLGSNSANPENIIGSAVDLYYTAVAIPETTLTPTDRIAIRVFISHAGRTITLHTQDNNLSEVITTISTGLTALNGLTDQVQYFQTGTSGTDFNISSSGDTHTFNVPTASAANTGKLSNSDWSNFDGKQEPITLTTTGTSGAATFDGTTLNIPEYAGGSSAFIPALEATEVRRGLIPLSGTTTVGTFGALTPVQTGSAVAVSFGGTTRLPKLRLLTTTGSTNSTVGVAFGLSGQVNTIIFGFRFVGTYIFSDKSAGGTEWLVPNARQFCGLAGTTILLPISSTNTLQSQINIIGIGSDEGDANLSIYHNGASPSATKIDLGPQFPANKLIAGPNSSGIQLELYCPWGATSVDYRVTKFGVTNEIVTGTITTNLPVVSTPLGPQVVRTSGSTSQNVSIDLIQLTSSTLY